MPVEPHRLRRAIAALALVLAAAVPARADESSYRAVIERVTLQPSTLTGQRLSVNMSLISLQGQVVDTPDSKSIKLLVGTSKVDAPFALGLYGNTDADTAIVFVIQASFDFADVLPVIGEAIEQNVLAAAGDNTQVGLLMFGESIGAARLGSAKSARSKVSNMISDGSVGQPVLLDSLDRALGLLRRAKTEPEGRPIRKMIVLVSDGRDVSAGPGTPTGDKDRVIKIGDRAAKEDVRIHSFAYSPKDIRKPLLLLGELSKRSLGTFRWVRGARADSWTPVFKQLQAEIARQMVLTFFLPADDDFSNKRIRIATTGRAEATSQEHKVPDVGCASGETCEPDAYCSGVRCVMPLSDPGTSILAWIFIVLGVIVALLVVLGVIGFFLTKREAAVAAVADPSRPSQPPPSANRAPEIPTVLPTAPPSAPPAPVMPTVPPTGPRFYIMNGPRAGEEIAIRHGFTIGKVPGCDLVIDDGYASSTHAQIGMDDFGNCRLYDRQSTNGTFVNGVRINEYPLEHGNTVRIGSIDLRFLSQ